MSSVKETTFYDILLVTPTADELTIKKSYRKIMMRLNADDFHTPVDQNHVSSICHAYDVLSDPIKRKLYDQYGVQGLTNQWTEWRGHEKCGFSTATDFWPKGSCENKETQGPTNVNPQCLQQ
eukprot:PhF_6_TR9610/c0_g1_i1/m.14857